MQTVKGSTEGIRVFFTGVGGQGTLLATRLLGEAAMEEGLPVSLSEIHGMAQRGGVVESSAVIGDLFSPTIAHGEADILMAFEPLEAVRALPYCSSKTMAVTSTVPIIPFTVATGKSTYPDVEELFGQVESKLERVIRVDAPALARRAGTERAANVVMMGVLAGTGELGISRASWKRAMEHIVPPRLMEVNEKAFALGFEMVSGETSS